MSSQNTKAIIETLKSFARAVWFSFLGLAVVILTNLAATGALDNLKVVVAGQTVSLSILLAATLGFVAKGIDSYVHKNENINSNGIAPGFLQK
jgi:hypothetical protein